MPSAGINQLIEASRELYPVLVAGAPVRCNGHLFNAAIVVHRGAIFGVAPKTYLPNYREFAYQHRGAKS